MKSKNINRLIIIMILISFIPINASAEVTYFPPSADWQQGYWDATAGSSGQKTDTPQRMTFTIFGGAGDGDEIYYVSSSAIDVTNLSYLNITWSGSFGAVSGACVLGIGTVQADKVFTTNTTKTSTFSSTTTELDVSVYTGDYYIKIGGYTSSAGLGDSIVLYVYDISGFNYSASFPMNATSIGETSATVNGYLTDDGGSDCTCGFWIGKNTTNISSFDKNCTASGTYNAGDTFSFSNFVVAFGGVGPLDPAQYYYCRTWSYNDYAFNYSSNETYFLTKPTSPSSFSVTGRHARSIDLSWTNATVGPNTNHSVLIHYDTTAPVGSPTPDTYGTFGANISDASITTISGLAEDTTYYFVAWTYANDSGSPSMGWISEDFATCSGATEGGIYNITVRYENESESGNCVVNLSHWRIHEFIIHYDTGTDYIRFDNGICYSTLFGYFGSNESGNITIETNETIQYIEFHWNGSVGVNKHCYRVQIVDTGQRNITFYIRTNLPVYGEGTTKDYHVDSQAVTDPTSDVTIDTTYNMNEIIGVYVYNITVYPMWETVPEGNYTVGTNQIVVDSVNLNTNTTMVKVEYYTHIVVSGVASPLENSLVSYTYYFKDETPQGYFDSVGAMDAWTEIYCYNSTNEKLTIHKEYWSSEQKIYPMLIYNKKYRVGVGCSSITIPLIGNAPTGSTLSPDALVIPDPKNMTYAFFDIIDIDAGWNGPGNGFWVYYQDTLYGTNSVTFRVWNNTGSMVYNETSTQDYKNFTYAAASDILFYNWTITTNHTSFTENVTIQAPMYPGMTPISNINNISDLLDTILGNTPFENLDPLDPLGRYGQTVPWAEVLVGVVAIIIILSFGYFNAYVGTIACGLWLSFSYGAISGLPVAYLFVGVFLVAMAVVFALGGKFR